MAQFTKSCVDEWFATIELLKEIKVQLENDPKNTDVLIQTFSHASINDIQGFYFTALGDDGKDGGKDRVVDIYATKNYTKDLAVNQEHPIRFVVICALDEDYIDKDNELPSHVKPNSFNTCTEAAQHAVKWLLSN